MVLQKKNFNNPDETQTPSNVRIENITIGDMTISKQTFQPGWQWLKDNKPIAKTDSCQMHHFGIWVSGKIRVRADDGEEIEFGSGDVSDIPPGHVGWVVGNEPAIFYAFICKTNPK